MRFDELTALNVLKELEPVQCTGSSGPICNFASLHLMSASDDFSMLEFQLGESRSFFDVVGGRGPQVADGCFAAPPPDPGLGLTLDDAVLAANPYRPVVAGLDPRLG